MDLILFVENFRHQFDETNPELISEQTRFRELEEWSSLVALSVISMINEEYDIILSADDLRACDTVEDVYTKVKAQ